MFESLGRVLVAGVDHELRCTWHPDLLSEVDLDTLANELLERGADLSTILPIQQERGGLSALAERFAHFTLRPSA